MKRPAAERDTTVLPKHAKRAKKTYTEDQAGMGPQVANVQTPEQCMKDALASTQGKWREDSHFQGILNDCFYRRDCLDYMEVNQGSSAIAEHIVEFAWVLLHHRCWSTAVRHHAPPNVYIGLKSSDAEKKEGGCSTYEKALGAPHGSGATESGVRASKKTLCRTLVRKYLTTK